ncbi:MAG: response regulator [Betaproteobacteria bacterium]|nr:response regulator [Betaproteobacteria bacterium]MCC6246319.1 response regulator [Rubrivivax sp.]
MNGPAATDAVWHADVSEGIAAAVQREMLRLALRTSTASVALLVMAFTYIAWVGWQAGRHEPALAVVALGVPASAWRLWLRRRFDRPSTLPMAAVRAAVHQLEINAALVGLMWGLATFTIYPLLSGMAATVYVVIVCGSVAVAASFMSLAGRSFVILGVMQLGSLVVASLAVPGVQSLPMAVLVALYGFAMVRAAREFRASSMNAMRHSLEVDIANDSLRQAKDAAEAANIAKSQFLATMSHEIRTPMNGVLGALELLRHTPLDMRQKRLVKTAAASGESLMDILNDVLDHSKIEAGKLSLVLTPLSLHSVATAAAALFRANAETRGLAITLQIGEGVPDGVIGDAPRLKQVLLNLIGNGVKFTERGGITLRLSEADVITGPEQRPDHRRVRFEVKDTGIGIPPEALAEVFLPFHQVHNARARLRGGTGLGLAISQRIIEAMGGRIEVDSRVGAGSAFTFELEFELAPHVAAASTDSDFGRLGDADRLQGMVLLVEDNMVNRLVGAEMLRSLGVEVLEAEDGAQGVAMLERQRVDLVLMDLQMPVLDGLSATRHVRERESRLRLPRVPIVALTANAFDEDVTASMAAGMDGHLAKPYSREQLYELLRRWL